MEGFIKLAEYKEYGIMIALVVIIYMLISKFLAHMKAKDCRDEKTYKILSDSIGANTKATNEMYMYLKLRNGSDTKNIMKAVAKYNKNK